MADWIGRLLGSEVSRRFDTEASATAVSPPSTNGNGHKAAVAPRLVKSAPVSFIPRDAHGNTIESPLYLTGRTGHATRMTAYAVAAYAYIAMRYRAEAVSEAPLMVVEETDDGEEWLKEHELAGFLDEPSPDYDMSELLYLTRIYRDMTGQAIWVKDADRAGRPGRLTPFHGDEFMVEKTEGRIFGRFRLTGRSEWMEPEKVIFFREPNPADWWRGLGWVDVALRTLNLGQEVNETARALLRNALIPSVVINTDPQWNPDDEEWEAFTARMDEQADNMKRGQPLYVTGGGRATPVAAKIQELLPSDLLDRVESVVASCASIPAIVLQYHVGIKNSPWSQMEEARRMAYEDAIERLWKRDEKALTRQLLRDVDEDPDHYVRFDRSRIRALKADDTKRAAVVAQLRDVWTIDQALIYTGQEPHEDPKIGGQIIAHARAALNPFGGGFGLPSRESGDGAKSARVPPTFRAATVRMVQGDMQGEWEIAVASLLADDRDAIATIARKTLDVKADGPTAEQRRRLMAEVRVYLETGSIEAWAAAIGPIVEANALRAAELLAAEIGVSLQLLRPDVLRFAEREAAWLVKEIAATTRDAIADALSAGIEAGEGSLDIARRIQDLPAFDRDRARLVARTETTRVMNGAPTEALKAREAETGRRYQKTWSAVLDDRVRDEHADMNGETVPIGATFSNGLEYPSEPNCRCVLLTSAVEGL